MRAERNYSATELECLTLIWGIRRMRSYLEEYEFTIITHQALKWLRNMDSPADSGDGPSNYNSTIWKSSTAAVR